MSEILSDTALFRYFYDRTAFVTIHGLTERLLQYKAGQVRLYGCVVGALSLRIQRSGTNLAQKSTALAKCRRFICPPRAIHIGEPAQPSTLLAFRLNREQ